MAAPQPRDHFDAENGVFRNPWKSFVSVGSFWTFMKMRLGGEWRAVEVPDDVSKVLPTVKPDFDVLRNPPPRDAVSVTWIGHATFLLQFDGFNVVTDPIFSERCAPVQFAGPKRIVPTPIDVKQLPDRIDAVIISHNHYDHTDEGTVVALTPRVERWYVPLGIREWLLSNNVPGERITELDWWGRHEFKAEDGRKLEVVCTPCQHFSGRTLWDRNRTLWASWAVLGPTQRVWFAGDTGYRSVPHGVEEEVEKKMDLPTCPAFAEIGAKYGPFDLACIPIGAYSPRYFMSPVHLNPFDAVKVHRDVRSRQSVGMHWGTFILTDEPILEPPSKLQQALKEFELPPEEFVALKHGETRVYEAKKN